MKKISLIHYLYGCRLDCLIKLMVQNKFEIRKGKRLQFFAIFFTSLVSYPFAIIESIISSILHRKNMEKEPLFILGFWRSGTTYLQNMLCKDEQFAYLNTITAYSNNYCMLLKPIVSAYMKKYSNDFRFMDNMECKIDSPCEEEFAFGNRTTKSIVHMSVFPENFELYKKFAFFENLSDRELKKWKKDYNKIIKKVYFLNHKKQLLLKSPDNTCHAKELSEMFPTSKFVYIYRNPYKVICSFKHTVIKMIEYFSFQEMPEEERVEDFVIDLYKEVMRTI